MRAKDLATLALLIIVVQASFGLLLFGLWGVGPGVNLLNIGVSLLVLVAISCTIGVVLYWIIDRYTRERAIRSAMMAMSEDEEKIFRIIMNEKKIRQDYLRRRVNFSKSKVSALVNNLVEKNALTKSRYMRTNYLEPTEEFKR